MMEKYQIIPRKFRPKRFDQVAGHEATVATLKNAIAQNRLGQAYLFCGGRGCGKTTLARLLACALNCQNIGEDYEPCNACVSCKEIADGRSLDVIEIDGASNRGIDDIRQINETVGYAPSKGRFKIYIIDEVHMLTKEAFNALLKTLEEPPKTVKFFFATTESNKIPQTIVSRCQRFNLSRIPQDALVEKLKRVCNELQVEAENEALVQISHLSEGSLRDAESLLDQLICYGKTPITYDLTRDVFGLLKTDQLLELDEAIHTQNQDKAFLLAKNLFESGKDLGACIDSLLEHFRTYLLTHLGHPAVGPYKKWAERYTKDQCLRLLDTLIEWQHQSSKTPFKRVHLEMLLATLVRKAKQISLDSLITRLLALEGKKPEMPAPEPAPVPVKPVPEPAPAPKPTPVKPAPAPTTEPAPEPKQEIKKELPKADPSSKHDTLIRFAAVELEGTVN